ncbi:hypothetical protein [Leisingera sp. S232]|uniref:hypothetical protein n=1 Tax=Leisingera sp. S232 TaxID=3415132 RepID=UPI003C7D9E8A
MNCTIKDATAKRSCYTSHAQLRIHVADFLDAYRLACRLTTAIGLPPYGYICRNWTSEPDRFILTLSIGCRD